MPALVYRRPKSLAALFDLQADHGSDAALLAGGTDLIVGLRSGKRTSRVVVDVKGVADLPSKVTEVGQQIVVGARTTLTHLMENRRVLQLFPALVDAAGTVGSVQIRNRATLIGNVCNASPAADTVPALLVHGATVLLLSPTGERRMPVADFILSRGRTDLRTAEIVAAVEIPLPIRPLGTSFARVTRRRGVDLATINICCAVDDQVTQLALGAVGPRTILVRDDTGLLADADTDASARRHRLEELLAIATPISDVRAGADYRRAMLLVHSQRALDVAIARRDEQVHDG